MAERSIDEIIAEASASGVAGGGGARSRRNRKASAAPEADAAPDAGAKARKPTPAMARLREGVLDIYTAAEMGCYLFDPFASQCIANTKEQCADAWIELAERDTKVKNFLIKLTTGSAWGNVVMAHASLALPILARRGVIPGGALFSGAAFNATANSGPPTGDPDAAAARAAAMADDLARQGFVTSPNGMN